VRGTDRERETDKTGRVLREVKQKKERMKTKKEAIELNNTKSEAGARLLINKRCLLPLKINLLHLMLFTR